MKNSRRDFLKEMGASAALLPFLPSLLPSVARADSSKPPLRLIMFWGFNGVHSAAFWPQAPTAQVATGVYSQKMSDLIAKNGQVSPIFGKSFNSLANKFSLIQGMAQCVSPYGANNIVHDAASTYSLGHIHENSDSFGFEAPTSGSSMDCIVEHSSGFYKSSPRISALRLSGGDPKNGFSFWRPNGGSDPVYNQVAPQQVFADDPVSVYNKLFGSAAAAPTSPMRRQVFEAVLKQFDVLSNSKILSSADKQRLTSHTSFLTQIRDSGSYSGGVCSPNSLSPVGNLRDRYANNFNSIATAFACDTTRIVTYTLDNYDDDGLIGWDNDHTNSHQDLSTNGPAGSATDYVGLCAKWRGWQADRIADLMTKLDSVKEFDGSSILDNTLIVWANQHGGTHLISNYPIMIAGGAQGQFRMGEHIDYRRRDLPLDDWNLGWPLSSLWMAIMRSLGVPAADYLKQGQDGAYGQAVRPADAYSYGFAGNLYSMRQQLIPYFYKGAA